MQMPAPADPGSDGIKRHFLPPRASRLCYLPKIGTILLARIKPWHAPPVAVQLLCRLGQGFSQPVPRLFESSESPPPNIRLLSRKGLLHQRCVKHCLDLCSIPIPVLLAGYPVPLTYVCAKGADPRFLASYRPVQQIGQKSQDDNFSLFPLHQSRKIFRASTDGWFANGDSGFPLRILH